jgi:hypothetical protein
MNCPNCNGTGTDMGYGDVAKCEKCDGTGTLPIPSPLTIEINEGLFKDIIRTEISIGFVVNHDDENASYRIYENGTIVGDGFAMTPKQINEIIRVRAALGWTGE